MPAAALTQAQLEQMLAARVFNLAKPPPPAEPVYTIKEVVVSTPGNLTVINAAVKTGKSAVIGAFLASAMKEDKRADTLGVESSNPKGLALIHLDTEQSIEDHWAGVERALKRAGRSDAPSWLGSFSLAGLSAATNQATLKYIVGKSAERFGGIHSILIDGVADLVTDVNNTAECDPFVASLHGLAIQYRCPIVNVIHFNPGTEKTRGHLGSQLERKAESNLTLVKKGDMTEVFSLKQRRRPIPRGSGPRFKYSQAAGMHVTDWEGEFTFTQLAAMTAEVEAAFEGKDGMRHKDLVFTVMTVTSKSDRTAERKIEDYRHAGLVEETDGIYRPAKPL